MTIPELCGGTRAGYGQRLCKIEPKLIRCRHQKVGSVSLRRSHVNHLQERLHELANSQIPESN